MKRNSKSNRIKQSPKKTRADRDTNPPDVYAKSLPAKADQDNKEGYELNESTSHWESGKQVGHKI